MKAQTAAKEEEEREGEEEKDEDKEVSVDDYKGTSWTSESDEEQRRALQEKQQISALMKTSRDLLTIFTAEPSEEHAHQSCTFGEVRAGFKAMQMLLAGTLSDLIMRLLHSKIHKEDLLKNASDITKKLVENGKIFESTACSSYTAWRLHHGLVDTGYTPTMFSHPTYPFPFITGSPDHLFTQTQTVAEFKMLFYPFMGKSQPILEVGHIPFWYYLQVQTYLEIMGWSNAHLFS
eukprot:m51a1_g4658 hypothetical protein (234) ;mRNA; r:65544-76294